MPSTRPGKRKPSLWSARKRRAASNITIGVSMPSAIASKGQRKASSARIEKSAAPSE
jgi:hypothetical protein